MALRSVVSARLSREESRMRESTLVLGFVASLAIGCAKGIEEAPSATADRSGVAFESDPISPATGKPAKITTDHLPNAVRVHQNVISGGQPGGEEGFAELKRLGVRTVISVDGMTPDVATARKHGLRYVHLPHGYDGIPAERVKELAKAVRDLEGPVYIHCHHGKHRSPAAASVACVAAGLLPESQALSVLELAGTSPSYRGLYESAEETRPLEAALLEELEFEFRETVEAPPMAEAMVALEHTHDHINQIALAGWRVPPEHPDLDPAHEALLLREHFTEMLRVDYVQVQPEDFKEMLRSSQSAARQLQQALEAWRPAGPDEAPPESLDRLNDRITTDCAACHEKYRNVPLSEK